MGGKVNMTKCQYLLNSDNECMDVLSAFPQFFHCKNVKKEEKRQHGYECLIELSSMTSPTKSLIPVATYGWVPGRVLEASLSCTGGTTAMEEPHGGPHDCGACGIWLQGDQ